MDRAVARVVAGVNKAHRPLDQLHDRHIAGCTDLQGAELRQAVDDLGGVDRREIARQVRRTRIDVGLEVVRPRPAEAMIQIGRALRPLNLWQGGGRTVGGSIVGCSQIADRVVNPRLQ